MASIHAKADPKSWWHLNPSLTIEAHTIGIEFYRSWGYSIPKSAQILFFPCFIFLIFYIKSKTRTKNIVPALQMIILSWLTWVKWQVRSDHFTVPLGKQTHPHNLWWKKNIYLPKAMPPLILNTPKGAISSCSGGSSSKWLFLLEVISYASPEGTTWHIWELLRIPWKRK